MAVADRVSGQRVLRVAAGNPLALLELPGARALTADSDSLPGGLPLTERLERAFAGRVSDLPDVTRLALLVAALQTETPSERSFRRRARLPGRPSISTRSRQPSGRRSSTSAPTPCVSDTL